MASRKRTQTVRAIVLGLFVLWWHAWQRIWQRATPMSNRSSAAHKSLFKRSSDSELEAEWCSQDSAAASTGRMTHDSTGSPACPENSVSAPAMEPETAEAARLYPKRGSDDHIKPEPFDAEQARLLLQAEAILFVASEPLTRKAFKQALAVDDVQLDQVLERLRTTLETRGIRLQEQADSWSLVSAPEAAEAIERLLDNPQPQRLSNAALEVLAIIAYHQPVTRAHIEAIRGVDSSGVVRSLLARELITEAGRAETIGRPILYSTTALFLQTFGLQRLNDLPNIELAEPDNV